MEVDLVRFQQFLQRTKDKYGEDAVKSWLAFRIKKERAAGNNKAAIFLQSILCGLEDE